VAYVPQRSGVDWDFPTNALDVVLMGTYGKLGWFRRPVKILFILLLIYIIFGAGQAFESKFGGKGRLNVKDDASARAEVAKQKIELDKVQGNLNQVQSQVGRLQRELEAATKAKAAAEAEANKAKAELANAQAEVGRLRNELALAKTNPKDSPEKKPVDPTPPKGKFSEESLKGIWVGTFPWGKNASGRAEWRITATARSGEVVTFLGVFGHLGDGKTIPSSEGEVEGSLNLTTGEVKVKLTQKKPALKPEPTAELTLNLKEGGTFLEGTTSGDPYQLRKQKK
jgi:hypothetical protein